MERLMWSESDPEQLRCVALLDHLVGHHKQCPGDCEAKGLRSLGVDQKAELGGLLDRQVSRLGTLENLGDIIESSLAEGAPPVVAHQTACPGVLGLRIYRGNFVTRRQRQNFWAIVEGKWKSADHECARLAFDKGRKGCLEVALAATFQDNDLQPKRACHSKQIARQHVWRLSLIVHKITDCRR